MKQSNEMTDDLAAHFEYWHNNPPPPFSLNYNPKAQGWAEQASDSMYKDGFYGAHSREECAVEWRRRYESLKNLAQ